MSDDSSSVISCSTLDESPHISIIPETSSDSILKSLKQESNIANLDDFIEELTDVEIPLVVETKQLKNSYLDEDYVKTRSICIKLIRKPGKSE